MTPRVSEAPPLDALHRLLGHPSDLAGHVAAHGPLQVSLGRHQSWQDALAAGLEQSGLTGRGGGGFPASLKSEVARAAGNGGTLLVNGMESEPASDKDKLLLLRSPHLVLDGAQYLAALCQAARDRGVHPRRPRRCRCCSVGGHHATTCSKLFESERGSRAPT